MNGGRLEPQKKLIIFHIWLQLLKANIILNKFQRDFSSSSYRKGRRKPDIL